MSSSSHFQDGLNTISKPELTRTKSVFFPLQDEDTLKNFNCLEKSEKIKPRSALLTLETELCAKQPR